MATGSAGGLQPAPAGQGAGDCSNAEQSQQVPTGKASSPLGDVRFINLDLWARQSQRLWAKSFRLSWFLFMSFNLSREFSLCVCLYAEVLQEKKGFLQGCIAGRCCTQPGTACLFSWCRTLQLHRSSLITEKSLLPPLGPHIPFLTWATPTPPGLRDQSLPLSGNQGSSVLQNNTASPCFSHTHYKQLPEHPG